MNRWSRIILLIVSIITISSFSTHSVDSSPSLVPLQRGTTNVYHYNTSNPVMIPSSYVQQSYDLRGIWVATAWNLNMPTHTSESQYKAAFDDLIVRVKNANMNAIFFQVRPMNDAFHASAYAPYSRYLTGVEGGDPGWDVLKYMIDTSHANDIEFHAWLNPYRVVNSTATKTDALNSLHPTNFARMNPDLVIAGNQMSGGQYPYILNPGEPAVKAYIRNVVNELMTLYDIDGIHFDDYFYPYSGLSSDTATYELYKDPSDQTLADFRRESVNDVVRFVKEDVDAYNSLNAASVRFGISPFGIWKSGGVDGSNTSLSAMQSYHSQYADSRKWVKEGWLHYIAPQVYWTFTHSLAPYADIVDWWASVTRGTAVDLLIGHTISGAHSSSWLTDEISTQLRYNQKHPEVKGSILFSAAFMHQAHLTHTVANHWTTTPLGTWAQSSIDAPFIELSGTKEGSVYRSDVTATIEAEHTIYYRIGSGDWAPYTTPLVFTNQGTYVLYTKAINSFGDESLIESATIIIDKINEDVPTISITGPQIGSSYITGAVLTLDATEPIYVAINHGSVGEWQLYTGPITLIGLGNHYIRTKTITTYGTESAENNLLVNIIAECYPNPTIQFTGTGTHPYYQQAVFSLSSSSPEIAYRINSGSWVIYSSPVTMSVEGEYTISYRNNDGCAVISTQTITIDKTAPSLPTISVEGAYDGRNYLEPVTVLFTPHNANDTIHYRIHNGMSWGSWQIYTVPFELSITAVYTVEYYSKDRALNISETEDERIRLDIAPTEDNPFVIRYGNPVNYYQTSTPVNLPTVYTEKNAEVRAVWVATVSNIDIGLHTSQAQYQSLIIAMLDKIAVHNFNVVFFQVRPMNDAFYPSSYAPFSRYLTGNEGVDPGWDVLDFMIKEAHKRGIELHAWLNPYRVSNDNAPKASQLSLLHDDNFAKQNPDFVLVDNNGRLILNPGEPQVRAYIINIIQELMANYDIDGIHFDDYFYSYSGMSPMQDESTYIRTRESSLQSHYDWRRENVNTLVRDIYNAVENYNQNLTKNVKFGISPFGIWKSGGDDGSNTSTVTMQSYRDQYADTKKWVEEGWVHYIMPQLYWEFSHNLAPFADLVDWWAALCEASGVDLIIGQGFYRYTDNSWNDENELLEQIRYMSQYDSIIGSAFFSYRTLNNTHPNVVKALARLNNYYWTAQADLPWDTDMQVTEPIVCPPGTTLQGDQCVIDAPISCPTGTVRDGDDCVTIPPPPKSPFGCFGGTKVFSLSTLSLFLGLLFIGVKIRTRYEL